MRTPLSALVTVVVASSITLPSLAQDDPHSETRSGRTMKPVITGRQYAVTSMKHQATEAAVRILEKGGNAFDAAVAGQAVLALVDPANNGYGSDAVVLVRFPRVLDRFEVDEADHCDHDHRRQY